MRHFEPCEVCGRSDVLIQNGLCFECNDSAERAAAGSKPFRFSTQIWDDQGRIRTVLAQRPRPFPDLEE